MKPTITLVYELYGVRNVAKFVCWSSYNNFTGVLQEDEFTKDYFKVIALYEKRKPAIWRWWYRHWGYKNS